MRMRVGITHKPHFLTHVSRARILEMSLLKFFKPVSGSLPTAEQTGLPENAVRSANHAVQNMLEKEPTSVRRRAWQLLPRRIVPRLANIILDDDQADNPFLDIHFDNSINSHCILETS